MLNSFFELDFEQAQLVLNSFFELRFCMNSVVLLVVPLHVSFYEHSTMGKRTASPVLVKSKIEMQGGQSFKKNKL